MNKITIKTDKEIETMIEGGKKLGRIKNELAAHVKAGVTAENIELLAQKLIKEEGGKPSFMMVPGYSWATCVNVNEGLVHGIPKKEVVFKDGDIVSIDVGIFYKGFHTDTSTTVGINASGPLKNFLETGRKALKKAISVCREGNYIFDISREIQETIEAEGYTPIRALVGHGVGRELHEEPPIPCFVPGKSFSNPQIKSGMTVAIEVMYTQGSPDIEIGKDGWTISVADGKISALFEESVAVRPAGPFVLTT